MSAHHDTAPAATQQKTPPSTPKSRLRAGLKNIREITIEERREDLSAAISQELRHLARARGVTVVVAAEVSRGKSLLINALVGHQDLLPVDIDVSTGVYVVVKYDEQAQARIFTRTSAEPTIVSLDSLSEWVSVAANPDNVKEVAYVEVGITAPLLKEGLSLIDTPGVGGLDAVHGATTLEALSDADALIFVLDASAPLSRPELNFLVKAADRVHSVVMVMTKTDVFPGWRTILDENRKLLQQYAPRFADQEIIRLRSPLFFEAAKRSSQGDAAAADRLRERSGIPLLTKQLEDGVLRRSTGIKVANGRLLALSVLAQLDAGYEVQLAALNGDTSVLRTLQQRKRDLTEKKSAAEGWRPTTRRAFTKVDADMQRDLQEEVVNFRSRFDNQIAMSWRRGEHLSFPAEVEADLRLLEVRLQRRLAEALRVCAGQQAALLGIDDVTAPRAMLTLPERDRLSVRPVSQGSAQLALVGGGLLSGGIGILKSLIGFNPVYAFGGVLGIGVALASLRTRKFSAEQGEARRLLQAYTERFQRDCKAAISDAVKAAAETTIEALQERMQTALSTLQTQIQGLTKQATEVKEIEATRIALLEKRATIAKLTVRNKAAIPKIFSPVTDAVPAASTAASASTTKAASTTRRSASPADSLGQPVSRQPR
jgi:ribosome biogenesis GTPase A